jgi:hypothetical protein
MLLERRAYPNRLRLGDLALWHLAFDKHQNRPPSAETFHCKRSKAFCSASDRLRHLDLDADTSQILGTKLKELKMKAGESRGKKSSKPE